MFVDHLSVRSKNLFAQIECVKCTEYDFVGPLTHQPLEIVMMIAQTVVNMIEKTIGMRYSSKSLKMNRNEKKMVSFVELKKQFKLLH